MSYLQTNKKYFLKLHSSFVTSKQCTGYIPHRPSIYEFTYMNDGNFTFERYLGGYYRDFVPKLMRRISRRRFDEDVRVYLIKKKKIHFRNVFFNSVNRATLFMMAQGQIFTKDFH